MRAERLPSTARGTVVSINTSDGGVPKLPVSEARVTVNGLVGDRQRDRRYHGGPDRAVCLYSLEIIQALQAEGHPIGIGSAGENLTVSGVDWGLMVPGRRVRAGHVVLELTRYAHPCSNLEPYFRDGTFTRISQKVHPGSGRLYARVLEEGVVRTGDAVEMLDASSIGPHAERSIRPGGGTGIV
jgi:MOSC domain-containing protein YiiM